MYQGSDCKVVHAPRHLPWEQLLQGCQQGQQGIEHRLVQGKLGPQPSEGQQAFHEARCCPLGALGVEEVVVLIVAVAPVGAQLPSASCLPQAYDHLQGPKEHVGLHFMQDGKTDDVCG